MKKCVNGELVELTSDEIAAMEAEAAKFEAQERTRPLTAEEVTRLLIAQQINGLTVDDNTALRMREFYPEWKDLIGTNVDAGFKFTHGGELYKTIPEQHSFQADWVPGVGTESLYTRIDETHAGTLEDPIPANVNMLYEKGKYYVEDNGRIYLCIRDDSADGTGTTLQYLPSQLVGNYFEEA